MAFPMARIPRYRLRRSDVIVVPSNKHPHGGSYQDGSSGLRADVNPASSARGCSRRWI